MEENTASAESPVQLDSTLPAVRAVQQFDEPLKSAKYKTLVTSVSASSTSENALNEYLENEKQAQINNTEPWCKLSKTNKVRLLKIFAESYKVRNELTAEEGDLLDNFIRDCLDRKKLQRVKDVSYDKETGEIKAIPSLHYTRATKHFTLKNLDKQRVSTLKSLPGGTTDGPAVNPGKRTRKGADAGPP